MSMSMSTTGVAQGAMMDKSPSFAMMDVKALLSSMRFDRPDDGRKYLSSLDANATREISRETDAPSSYASFESLVCLEGVIWKDTSCILLRKVEVKSVINMFDTHTNYTNDSVDHKMDQILILAFPDGSERVVPYKQYEFKTFKPELAELLTHNHQMIRAKARTLTLMESRDVLLQLLEEKKYDGDCFQEHKFLSDILKAFNLTAHHNGMSAIKLAWEIANKDPKVTLDYTIKFIDLIKPIT